MIVAGTNSMHIILNPVQLKLILVLMLTFAAVYSYVCRSRSTTNDEVFQIKLQSTRILTLGTTSCFLLFLGCHLENVSIIGRASS